MLKNKKSYSAATFLVLFCRHILVHRLFFQTRNKNLLIQNLSRDDHKYAANTVIPFDKKEVLVEKAEKPLVEARFR